jgi:hypothetical protein
MKDNAYINDLRRYAKRREEIKALARQGVSLVKIAADMP